MVQPLIPVVNINTVKLERGLIYSFSYNKIGKGNIVQPIFIFSFLGSDRQLHGMNVRLLKYPRDFLLKYESNFLKDGKIKYKENEPMAFTFELIKPMFSEYPDISVAWRTYDVSYIKSLKNINIQEAIEILKKPMQVQTNNFGVK